MKAFILLVVTFFMICKADAQWVTQSIDTISTSIAQNVTGRLSLVRDNAGTQHSAWMEAGPSFNGYRIFYAKKLQGSNWSTPVPVTDQNFGAYSSYISVNKLTGDVFITYTKDISGVSQVFLATQNGVTFTNEQITIGGNDKYSPAIAIDNAGRVHLTWVSENVSNEYKIFYATNLGGSFVIDELAVSNPGEFGSGASPYIAVSNSGISYIAFRSGGFANYKISIATNSEPGGAVWSYEELITDNTNDYDGMLYMDNSGTLHIVISGADDSVFPGLRNVYYTRKSPGQNWIPVQHVSVQNRAIDGSMVVDHNGDVHIVMNLASGNFVLGTVIYATNKSGSWLEYTVINDGEAYRPNISIDNDGKGYIIAFQGEWNEEDIIVVNSQNQLTNIKQITGELPDGYSLWQNYPNPFNPETTIRFSLKSDGFVSLKLFDMLGKEIAVLLNERKPAGVYEYQFNASSLTSGIYYYRLESGDFTQTKKMMLIK